MCKPENSLPLSSCKNESKTLLKRCECLLQLSLFPACVSPREDSNGSWQINLTGVGLYLIVLLLKRPGCPGCVFQVPSQVPELISELRSLILFPFCTTVVIDIAFHEDTDLLFSGIVETIIFLLLAWPGRVGWGIGSQRGSRCEAVRRGVHCRGGSTEMPRSGPAVPLTVKIWPKIDLLCRKLGLNLIPDLQLPWSNAESTPWLVPLWLRDRVRGAAKTQIASEQEAQGRDVVAVCREGGALP